LKERSEKAMDGRFGFESRGGVSRRWFIGAMASAGAAAGCRQLGCACEETPLLRFGVVSDVHMRLSADGRTLERAYDTATFERTLAFFRDNGADAVVIAGDIADSGLFGELKAMADAWYRVFPGDRAPDGRKVERIFVFGNHDAFGLKNGSRVFKDAAALRMEAIEADPVRAWDACFHEEWKPFFSKNVKGYDFFCSHWKPGVWCNGIAETGCSGCGDAFRAAMAKCDPSKPFFYVQHPHPRDTVYGNCAWGQDDGSATKLLSAFPQAVAFSGHSHEPLTNEKAIWRGAFTSVATGSLRYLSAGAVWNRECTAGYENGGCNYYLPGVTRADRPAYISKYDAPKVMPSETSRFDIRVGQLVSVYGDRIVFEKREFESGLVLCDDWTVELPAKPRSFSVRATETTHSEFPAGAALAAKVAEGETRGMKPYGGAPAIAPAKTPVVELEFPSAAKGGRVAEYEIALSSPAGWRRTTRICALDGLYPAGHAKAFVKVSAKVPVSAAAAEAGVEAVVTPLDSFGGRGRALAAKASRKSGT